MNTVYRIYLDVCCLNRPLDNSLQERIRLEAEAVLLIYRKCRLREWSLINSEAIEAEIAQDKDAERRLQLQSALEICETKVMLDEVIENRVRELITLGFKPFDATHLACAEAAEADIFLTTDDRLLKRAFRLSNLLNVMVRNPANWFIDVNQSGEEE
ncbi:hypothetical protein [Leptolyngbya sp. PCC 6406]|uniref:hypothetical protein n=1 Tax=Leptolyngbya sp. PCC 6406 TaxID=1173264 RepID=UPI0002ABB11D|nr:hypothetical protein [Leptolyngbya sp. PCC 6406]